MYGSIVDKIARAGLAFAERPVLVGRYLSSQLSTPIKLGTPWLSYPAIEFLMRWSSGRQQKAHVLEYGSGGSTIFWRQFGFSVVSVESESEWQSFVENELQRRGLLSDFEIRYSELKSSADVEKFVAAGYGSFDVVLIDSAESSDTGPVRLRLFEFAETVIKPGGIIVFDDSWRYGVVSGNFNTRIDFKGLGPCRPGVTQTSIFFY